MCCTDPVQVRAMAVCRAWLSFLDPRLLPIEDLSLSDFELHLEGKEGLRIAAWLTATQPALRSLQLLDLLTSYMLPTLASLKPASVSIWGCHRSFKGSLALSCHACLCQKPSKGFYVVGAMSFVAYACSQALRLYACRF